MRALLEAGVVVAAGADNLQDPFNPIGRGCPFETAALMVLTAHLRPADAWASVTERAAAGDRDGHRRRSPSASRPTCSPCRRQSLREAIASGAPDRTVWRHGRQLVV